MESGQSLEGNSLYKYNFLKRKRLLQENLSYYESFKICILGINIEFRLSSHNEIILNFLKSYYAPFTKSFHEKNPTTIISIHPLEEHLSLGDKLWSDRWPSFHMLENSDGYFLIERDYMARTSKDLTRVDLYCPLIEEGNPDTLDNLLMVIFSHFQRHHQTMLLHSAAVVKEGKAYVFFGKSGAGKSTLAHQCFDMDGLKIVGSDQVFLRLKNAVLYAQASPTTIPELLDNPEGRVWEEYPVAGLIHLNRQREEGLYSMTKPEIFPKFMAESLHYLIPSNSNKDYLEFITRILSTRNITLSELSYRKGQSFWQWINF